MLFSLSNLNRHFSQNFKWSCRSRRRCNYGAFVSLLLGFSQHQAQGTSLAVLVVPVTGIAVYNYYKEGYIDWRYAAIIAVFFVVGGYFGSKMAINIDQKILKKIFGFILLLIAGKMLFGK